MYNLPYFLYNSAFKYIDKTYYICYIFDKGCVLMKKQVYDLLFGSESEPKKKMNEPFCFMKAEVALNKKNFSIWKLNYNHQNTHAHDYYQIWYILRGSCRHRIDNHKFSLSSGDIIFIPPFSYHSMSDGSMILLSLA